MRMRRSWEVPLTEKLSIVSLLVVMVGVWVLGIIGFFAMHSTTGGFELTLVHTNDVHARFEEFDAYGGICQEAASSNGECFGGVARRQSALKEIRSKESNVIFLDAGDQFQGTTWFSIFEGSATSFFMKLLQYDAMCLGNHEFDKGLPVLVNFIGNLSSAFPVLCANADMAAEPELEKGVAKSAILNVTGEKIGVVGYTTSQMPNLSLGLYGKVKWLPEVESVQKEVDVLRSQGVNKIIALGHSGFETDLDIAKRVDGVDIVVGGHDNTFLYNGKLPSVEKPAGPYPTVVTQNGGAKVLVVQDFTFAKYLGHLKVTFNQAGDVISWDGNPILLDASVPKDAEIERETIPWREKLSVFRNNVIGQSYVFLDGQRSTCRNKECNLGNLIADAMVFRNHRPPTNGTGWAEVSLALLHSGGIRSSINEGNITVEMVMNAFPFQDTVDLIEIKGKYLRETFEHSVSRQGASNNGRFLQVSGFVVSYDISKPVGKRVASVSVRCADCRSPQYEPLEEEKVYKVWAPTFLANGGDGHVVIKQNQLRITSGVLDTTVYSDYISVASPIMIGEEQRIRFMNSSTTSPPCVGSGSPPFLRSPWRLPTCVVVTSFLTMFLSSIGFIY